MTGLERSGVDAVLRRLKPGERIYMPGSSAEVPSLTAALLGEAAPPLKITATLVPGINPLPKALFRDGCVLRNPFAIAPAGAQAAGSFSHMPLSYGAFGRALHAMEFDTCIVHVSPPGADGRASLGPSVEFTPLAMTRARRVIALVNPAIPFMPGSVSIDLRVVDAAIEIESPLPGYVPGEPGEEALVIANHIAGFIDDEATIQIGLGKVPDALLKMLRTRRKLRFHSGMLSDGFRDLVEAGAVNMDIPAVSCVHVGSPGYYAWLEDRGGIEVQPVSRTHAPATLASLQGLIAVNSALSVDLFGQANLERAGSRAVSGVGGAADFARGAALNPQGVSIIGMPSLGPKGRSRIVAGPLEAVSLPRQDIDVVVTEHGVADLRALDVRDRAEKLIAVAAPEHRSDLTARMAETLGGL